MTTLLIILGAPEGAGLPITEADIKTHPQAPQKDPLTCNPGCIIQNSGTAIMLSESGQPTTCCYDQRYPEAALPLGLVAALPKGAAVLEFDEAQRARSWYNSLKPKLGLHVAYFFDGTENKYYAT